eukprot:1721289-Pyramimonas_sp.AAC.1
MVAGTSGWIEHPLPAHWRPEAPSSFHWEPLEALASAPITITADFDQCTLQPTDRDPAEFGRAPTRLLGLRMPCLRSRLCEGPGNG